MLTIKEFINKKEGIFERERNKVHGTCLPKFNYKWPYVSAWDMFSKIQLYMERCYNLFTSTII